MCIRHEKCTMCVQFPSEVTTTADRLTPSSGPLWLRDLEKIGL